MVKLIKLHNVTLEYANNKNGILLDVVRRVHIKNLALLVFRV